MHRVGTLATATAQRKHRPSILYGFTKPQFIPAGEHSISVAGCPRRYHPTNGTVAAQNGSDAQYLTIRGSGPLANSKGKIKGWFIDLNVATSPTPVPALGSIVCQR